MDEFYRERFRRHAAAIREIAEANRRNRVVYIYEKRQMAIIGQVGNDVYQAFRKGFFRDPQIGAVIGRWLWCEMEGDRRYFSLLTENIRQHWYSLEMTAPFRHEIDEEKRVVTNQGAIDRFYDETTDLVDALTYFSSDSGNFDSSDGTAKSSLLSALKSVNQADGQTIMDVFSALCAVSCIDPSFDHFIDEMIHANYPYAEKPELNAEVLAAIKSELVGKPEVDPDSTDYAKLERETPRLDTTSGEWFRTREMVGERSGGCTNSDLETAREKGRRLYCSDDKLFVVDAELRRIRKRTPNGHCWYWVGSSKRSESPQPPQPPQK